MQINNNLIYFWIFSGAGKPEDLSSGGHSRTAVCGRPETRHGLQDPQRPENQCCSQHLTERHSGVRQDWMFGISLEKSLNVGAAEFGF